MIIDDQSPALWASYQGNWTHYDQSGFNNNTVTATPNVGASLSVDFSGSQAWLFGAIKGNPDAEGDDITFGYPTANYLVDGVSAGSQTPFADNTTGKVIYFQTPKLADANHTIEITVTTANDTNLFIIDYFLITPSANGGDSGVATTRPAPGASSSVPITTTQATPVGPIVGGVVGGIAGIAILCIVAFYFLRRRNGGGRAYYFEKPGAADVLAAEDQVEPFDTTTVGSPPASAAGFSQAGPQSTYSDANSQQPLRQQAVGGSQPSQYTSSGPSEGGLSRVTGTTAQPRTGKAALIAQQQDAPQPVQYEDSGVRFNQGGVEEAGPSQLPVDVPPSYTPN